MVENFSFLLASSKDVGNALRCWKQNNTRYPITWAWQIALEQPESKEIHKSTKKWLAKWEEGKMKN